MPDPRQMLDVLKRELPAHGDLHYWGSIPKGKLDNVCKLYRIADPTQVLLLYDDTLFGSAAEGFIVTASHFGFKCSFEDPELFELQHLRPADVRCEGDKLLVKGKGVEITGGEAGLLAGGAARALWQILGGAPAAAPPVAHHAPQPAPQAWTCAYCGSLNPGDAFSCQRCTAPRR